MNYGKQIVEIVSVINDIINEELNIKLTDISLDGYDNNPNDILDEVESVRVTLNDISTHLYKIERYADLMLNQSYNLSRKRDSLDENTYTINVYERSYLGISSQSGTTKLIKTFNNVSKEDFGEIEEFIKNKTKDKRKEETERIHNLRYHENTKVGSTFREEEIDGDYYKFKGYVYAGPSKDIFYYYYVDIE